MTRCAFFTTSGTCCHPENPDKGSVAAKPEQTDETCPHCEGSGWESNSPASCSWCEGTKKWKPDPPAEPTTAEAFATCRDALAKLYGLGRVGAVSQGTMQEEIALSSLALLERRMQDSPSLAVLVEGFCSEVENAKFSRNARRSGGQTVGTVSPFEHVQPSVAMALERWARDFRETLKK